MCVCGGGGAYVKQRCVSGSCDSEFELKSGFCDISIILSERGPTV